MDSELNNNHSDNVRSSISGIIYLRMTWTRTMKMRMMTRLTRTTAMLTTMAPLATWNLVVAVVDKNNNVEDNSIILSGIRVVISIVKLLRCCRHCCWSSQSLLLSLPLPLSSQQPLSPPPLRCVTLGEGARVQRGLSQILSRGDGHYLVATETLAVRGLEELYICKLSRFSWESLYKNIFQKYLIHHSHQLMIFKDLLPESIGPMPFSAE